MTRQAVSNHLAALADAGLVRSRRDGWAVRFRITPAPLSGAMAWIVGAQWGKRLAELHRELGGR